MMQEAYPPWPAPVLDPLDLEPVGAPPWLSTTRIARAAGYREGWRSAAWVFVPPLAIVCASWLVAAWAWWGQ